MKLRVPWRVVWARAVFAMAALAFVLCGAQAEPLHLPALFAAKKKKVAPAPLVRATLQPSFTIAAEPLGFAAPGEFYLGARWSLVSLDFIGEDRLLFTFRVPGLIHRNPNDSSDETERRIRAVVLHLPEGSVEAETVWKVHDRARYLYMLGNGQFLFRDRDNLMLGDATLQLKPFLRFPGPVRWVEMDPAGQYLVTISHEPQEQKPAAGTVGSPDTAKADVTKDNPSNGPEDLVLRILRRDTGMVLLLSRIRDPLHLPINGDGYLETLRAEGKAWTLNLDYFDGGHRTVGSVDSVCSPVLDFVSKSEFLATTCGSTGDPRLVALAMNGRRLWETPPDIPAVWPQLVTSNNGLRLAWESLLVDHAVNAAAPLGIEDVKGQDVQVMDAATGKRVLRAAASPVFDAGGNVAISPSGRRVAIVINGNIQVFELADPPPLDNSNPVLHRAAR